MKRIWLILTLCLFACNVFAENLKIGVVNLDQVLQKSALAASLNEKLSKDFKPRQDELNAAIRKLQDDSDQLIYNTYKMTADERNKLQTTVANDRKKVDTLGASLQTDIANAQAVASQKLMSELNTVVSKIATDGKYDIIQTNANMIYINSGINITDQVIDQLK